MRIYLVGFMQSGKTTLGREVADRLHVPFFDLDELIERQAEMSIEEIFSEKGEYFSGILNWQYCIKRMLLINLLLPVAVAPLAFLTTWPGSTSMGYRSISSGRWKNCSYNWIKKIQPDRYCQELTCKSESNS